MTDKVHTQTKTHTSIIPGGLTTQLQPADGRSSQLTGICAMKGWYQERNRTLMPGTCVLQTSFSALSE